MGTVFVYLSDKSVLGIKRSHAPLVGKGPGAIAFNRIPLFPHSTAKLCVIADTPALAMAEGVR